MDKAMHPIYLWALTTPCGTTCYMNVCSASIADFHSTKLQRLLWKWRTLNPPNHRQVTQQTNWNPLSTTTNRCRGTPVWIDKFLWGAEFYSLWGRSSSCELAAVFPPGPLAAALSSVGNSLANLTLEAPPWIIYNMSNRKFQTNWVIAKSTILSSRFRELKGRGKLLLSIKLFYASMKPLASTKNPNNICLVLMSFIWMSTNKFMSFSYLCTSTPNSSLFSPLFLSSIKSVSMSKCIWWETFTATINQLQCVTLDDGSKFLFHVLCVIYTDN